MKLMRAVAVLMLVSSIAMAQDYEDVKLAAVELAPKDFTSRSVTYEAVYLNFSSTIPTYMQWNNIMPDKYLILSIGDAAKLPVVIRVSDEVKTLVSGFKKGDTVRVYGKVKEFSVKSPHAMAPSYYLEADKLEKIDKPASSANESKPQPPPRRKRVW